MILTDSDRENENATGLPSLLVPSGLWHFALSVGVCSLVDNNTNNNNNNNNKIQ